MTRVAVAGFGFMVMAHTLNILKNKNLRLVAIADKDLSLIEKNLTSKSGNLSTGSIDPADLTGIRRYSSLDDCLLREDIDAVSICTHVNLHYGMARNALLHDKHVFLEKPFCLDVKQAEELIRLAKERRKILMIGHVVRFMPPYQKLKKWVDSKEYGKLKFISFSRICGLPSWGQWKEKNVRELSGGALFDLVIHDIDFASWLFGKPSGIKCHYLPGEYSNHDYVSAMWNYSGSDLNVKIEGGFTFHSSFPFQATYMAQFENASLLYASDKSDVIQIADNEGIREVPAGNGGDGYYNEIDYFARCIRENIQPEECMPESSLQSVQLCYNHLTPSVK